MCIGVYCIQHEAMPCVRKNTMHKTCAFGAACHDSSLTALAGGYLFRAGTLRNEVDGGIVVDDHVEEQMTHPVFGTWEPGQVDLC